MVYLDGKLRLHPAFAHRVVRVGCENTPVLVIDNFLADAQVLVDYAVEHCTFAPAGAYYPGVRAPFPPIYAFAVRAFLADLIRDTFALPTSTVVHETCDFSIVTTHPENLLPLQRIPHVDNANPTHFAVLHYLCGREMGGTSFYRHRGTGFENVFAERFPAYRAAVEAELAADPPPARYSCGDSKTFERIHSFEAAFNRVIVYRGLTLHGADIAPDFAFDADPRRGRLTGNAFFVFG